MTKAHCKSLTMLSVNDRLASQPVAALVKPRRVMRCSSNNVVVVQCTGEGSVCKVAHGRLYNSIYYTDVHG